MARAKEDLPEPRLYERDYALWIEEQVRLLRSGDFSALDLENLIDEIEGLSRSDRHAIRNNLIVVIRHLLKYQFQPAKRTRSWLLSIAEHRRRAAESLEDSPSLVTPTRELFPKLYAQARQQAILETGLSPKRFPETPPFTLEQALDPDFLPE